MAVTIWVARSRPEVLPLAPRLVPAMANILMALTPVYWLVQGTVFTGIFVVGHDAGHGSFSNSELVNTICGNICHTFLLCPYYMWKVSIDLSGEL
ncbi:omega-3 fatty acid desaturase [Elysia marginata]|uniref:Omega-3 fatty acid desaturase n=1 Tax=Elysia marginata TaxID=1093978 RepID=A0AAV4F151_9GAST|nr:omega-3 fatty acid desaturase [Elysia marginata]